jgi:hypothetical protein
MPHRDSHCEGVLFPVSYELPLGYPRQWNHLGTRHGFINMYMIRLDTRNRFLNVSVKDKARHEK